MHETCFINKTKYLAAADCLKGITSKITARMFLQFLPMDEMTREVDAYNM